MYRGSLVYPAMAFSKTASFFMGLCVGMMRCALLWLVWYRRYTLICEEGRQPVKIVIQCECEARRSDFRHPITKVPDPGRQQRAASSSKASGCPDRSPSLWCSVFSQESLKYTIMRDPSIDAKRGAVEHRNEKRRIFQWTVPCPSRIVSGTD